MEPLQQLTAGISTVPSLSPVLSWLAQIPARGAGVAKAGIQDPGLGAAEFGFSYWHGEPASSDEATTGGCPLWLPIVSAVLIGI
jgi:hypothetical protein